jgi:hypothetical protein
VTGRGGRNDRPLPSGELTADRKAGVTAWYGFIVTVYEVPRMKSATVFGKGTGITAV